MGCLIALFLVLAYLPTLAGAAVPSTTGLPVPSIGGTAPIVWASTTVGNTVYAGGHFNQYTWQGVTKTQSNVIAFDLTTGAPKSFPHTITTTTSGKDGVLAVERSPSGRWLAIGGKFTAVDGQPRSNLAVFDLSVPGGKLMPGFTGTDARVLSLALTDTRLYVGGYFTRAANVSRKGLAAYNLPSGALATEWSAHLNPGGQARALLALPDKLIVGGWFTSIRGVTYYSSGAVRLDTGSVLPWASQSPTYPIRDQMTTTTPVYQYAFTYISSLTTDGTSVFLTSEGDGALSTPPDIEAFLEHTAAVSPADGSIRWVNDCHGNTHDAFPMNGVLYSVSHAHDCSNMGVWGQLPASECRPVLAETTSGVVGPNGYTVPGYTSFTGYGHTSQYAWYPTLTNGGGTPPGGRADPTWTVTGGSGYLVVGGQFGYVNGKAQRGLARFGPVA